jgi:hypothetical protein
VLAGNETEHTEFQLDKLKRRDCLEDLVVDEIIILKLILKKWVS